MLVRKCDKCKKRILDADRTAVVTAGVGYDKFEFCKKCGAPFVRTLRKYKLVK